MSATTRSATAPILSAVCCPIPPRDLARSPIPTAGTTLCPFGPVGRNFFPRFQHAGTYDRQWLENHAPFWPADFNDAYFQCAPPGQQVPFLRGGEEVELHNLTADGWRRFNLPVRSVPITFLPYRAPDIRVDAVCDTLLIEPDQQRFTMAWRASLPLRRSACELRQTIVGEMPCSWRSRRRALTRGKRYYANLRELIETNCAARHRNVPRRKDFDAMTAISIRASGMVTAVGLSGPASLAAIRAGIRAVKQTNLWDAESGTYLPAGKAPLPQWWVGLGKLADLAAPAIHECLQAAASVPPEAVPVLLALPPHDRPFRTPDLDTGILPEIEDRLGHSLHRASRIIARDHVSGSPSPSEKPSISSISARQISRSSPEWTVSSFTTSRITISRSVAF